MICSSNPATGEELRRFPLNTDAEVDAVLESCWLAQAQWRHVPIEKRCLLLRRVAETLRAAKPRLAALATAEMGKPIVESEAEIEKCAINCDFYAEAAPRFLADEIVESSATESRICYDPLGVVLAIMPWNYPYWQFFRFAAPALAAGNGAILKHAANVPQCAAAIVNVMRMADCPEGLFANLFIETNKVAAIIADDRIAAVTLTGSTEVGGIVAAQAGKALKKQVLELGGSDPFIVLADADVAAAVETAVRARFINVGQSCVNAKRFIVEEAVADRFVDAFVRNVARLKVGDPQERDVAIGPMARANLRETLHEQVERTLKAGAVLRIGGAPIDRPGYWYKPTILDGVTPDMPAFREETFGPVAAIIRARDEDDAIRLANKTEYGLGAAIWTNDLAKARSLASRIEAGAVFINGLVASDPRLPFGGIKRSGYGRELGAHGIREFTNVKTLWIGPAKVPFRRPRGGRGGFLMTSAQPAVFRPDQIKPRERGGGARTIPLVSRASGTVSFINGITIFEPGAAIPVHKHNCEESVTILEGRAIAEIDGVQHELKSQDTTFIPANFPHRFVNASNHEPMKILWIYASVDANRTMVDTGHTQSIDDEHTSAPGHRPPG